MSRVLCGFLATLLKNSRVSKACLNSSGSLKVLDYLFRSANFEIMLAYVLNDTDVGVMVWLSHLSDKDVFYMRVHYCLFGRLVGRLVALPCFDICCVSCFHRAFIIVALVCFVLSCYDLYCLPTFALLFYALLALVRLCLLLITCFALSPCSSPPPPPSPATSLSPAGWSYR